MLNSAGVRPVSSAARELSLLGRTDSADGLHVAVRLRAFGNENSASFSVGFDAGVLEFESVRPGTGVRGAALLCNDRAAAEGRVGIALALPAGGCLLPGMPNWRCSSSDAGPGRVRCCGCPPVRRCWQRRTTAGALAVQASAESYFPGPATDRALSIVSLGDADGPVTLEFQGAPGTPVVLEVSGDLVNWEVATEPVVADDTGLAWFTQSGQDTPRFFRVRQLD
ncbi:MAG: hypothetical protein H7A46_08605 [Verrucomicrobiales bacterium]|nr:hypothetical protein [Verrucomicrobiales bacterium]